MVFTPCSWGTDYTVWQCYYIFRFTTLLENSNSKKCSTCTSSHRCKPREKVSWLNLNPVHRLLTKISNIILMESSSYQCFQRKLNTFLFFYKYWWHNKLLMSPIISKMSRKYDQFYVDFLMFNSIVFVL